MLPSAEACPTGPLCRAHLPSAHPEFEGPAGRITWFGNGVRPLAKRLPARFTLLVVVVAGRNCRDRGGC
jgi:hypothetical protein